MSTTANWLKSGLMVLSVHVFLFALCNKEPRPCPGGGGCAFLATAEWSPQRETYRVGDTLYLSSTIPKTLTDQINPSMVVDYSNSAGIGGDLSMIFLDSVARQPRPGKDSFVFVSIVGSFEERPSNREYGMNIRFIETIVKYQFKGAIVCKKKGAYGIGVQNLLSRGLRGKDCSNANFDVSLTNTQKNLSIWENALNIVIDINGKKKGYAFRVE